MIQPRLPTLGRLSGAARFERVLALRPCAKSSHFSAFHHVGSELSTTGASSVTEVVDGYAAARQPIVVEAPRPSPAAGLAPRGVRRLGLVVPKRFARRAVTRNLIKRQMRSAMRAHFASLAAGDWVLRLRAPVALPGEAAAATAALRHRVHGELATLLASAARRCPARDCAAAAGA